MSRLMGMTGFGFIGLYALFTRAFTSLTDISIDYRVILASSCCVALIVVAVAMRGVRRHAVALSFVASLAVFAAFVVQSTLFLGMAESGAVWAVLLSSALMGFGYALYWPLWVIAL